MPLLSFVRDVDTGDPVYAVLATDAGATYVFRDEEREFDASQFETTPSTADEWVTAATLQPGAMLAAQAPFEIEDEDEAYALVQTELEYADPEARHEERPSDVEMRQALAASEVQIDNPEILEDVDDGDFDDQALLNIVMMSLGEIDPDGPNGWLLRAAEGEEPPEDAFVTFAPHQVESEEETE